jgi:hypothetical protein
MNSIRNYQALQTPSHIRKDRGGKCSTGRAKTLVCLAFRIRFAISSQRSTQMCHCHGMPDAFCEKSMHNTFITSAHNLRAPAYPLLCCSLAFGVLLGGIGNSETCEWYCISICSHAMWLLGNDSQVFEDRSQLQPKNCILSNPKSALCHSRQTYWVAAIASTSRPSLSPSRRVCRGVVSSGP